MKKINLFLILILALVVGLSACSSTQETTEAETTVAETTQMTTAESELPIFNAEELAKYNGKDGNRAYVAYEGKVYDVTDIPAWKGGVHQNRLEAGKDYTEVLNNDAPHSATNLTDNAPVVGIYE